MCSLDVSIRQGCVHSTHGTWMPNSYLHFLCSVDHEIGVKTSIWHKKIERLYHTLTKNFNLMWDRWTDRLTDTQTKNIMPPGGA